MRKGEITIGIGVLVTIGIAAATFFWNAVTKADTKAQTAIDANRELTADVKVIKNDVAWLRQILEKNQSVLPHVASTTFSR